MNEIKSHEQLLKLHGKKVSFKINGMKSTGKISVGTDNEKQFVGCTKKAEECVFICHNLEELAGFLARDLFNYNKSWLISSDDEKFSNGKNIYFGCKEVYLEEEQLEFQF
jgi:hypothetical protein